MPGDSRWRLLALGVRGARARFDVSIPLRLVLGAWVLAVGLTPRPALPLLVRLLAIRETRWLTPLLRRLHRGT